MTVSKQHLKFDYNIVIYLKLYYSTDLDLRKVPLFMSRQSAQRHIEFPPSPSSGK